MKDENGSIQDIAKAANVSTATVSRVFNRHPYVSDEIREKVLKISRKMNYAPHISSSRFVFGIMVCGDEGFMFDAYNSQLLHYMTKRIFELGYNAQIFGPRQMPYLHKNTFRGVIVLSSDYAKQLKELGIPVLLINNFKEGITSLLTDHKAGLELAVNYLAEKGHSKIAYLRSANNISWGSEQRELGYRAAMERLRIPPKHLLIDGYKNEDDIPEAISLLLKKSPTALIVEGESASVPANYALFLLNKKVPQDISLITFEDDTNSRFMTPPQTAITQDFETLAENAVDMIIAISSSRRKQKIPEKTIIPCNRLIIRHSVTEL